MVSILDVLDGGISAVYTFFAIEPKSSYGTFNVLWQLAQAKRLGLNYVYLGYWIDQSPKMRYKSQFGPFELLLNGQWVSSIGSTKGSDSFDEHQLSAFTGAAQG